MAECKIRTDTEVHYLANADTHTHRMARIKLSMRNMLRAKGKLFPIYAVVTKRIPAAEQEAREGTVGCANLVQIL